MITDFGRVGLRVNGDNGNGTMRAVDGGWLCGSYDYSCCVRVSFSILPL